MMHNDGSNPRTVAEFNLPGRVDNLAWSPDGTQFLFAYQKGAAEEGTVYVVDNGGNARILTAGAGVAWSPDGSQIAVSRGLVEDDYSGHYLYTIAPDGTSRQVLANIENGVLKAAK